MEKTYIDGRQWRETNIPREVKVTKSGHVVDVLMSRSRLQRSKFTKAQVEKQWCSSYEPVGIMRHFRFWNEAVAKIVAKRDVKEFQRLARFGTEFGPFCSDSVAYYRSQTRAILGTVRYFGVDVSRETSTPETSTPALQLFEAVKASEEKPKESRTRADFERSLRATFARLRQLFNCNSSEPERCKWITLTYAQPDGEPVRDVKRVQEDFERYIRRMRRKFGHVEYLAVLEPQSTGSWHYHCLLIFDQVMPFIDKEWHEHIWGQGFTKINNCNNVDNLGAYLSAYCCDIEVSEATPEQIANGKIVVHKNEQGKKKKFVKGGRLHYYPENTHLYRCSKGIKRPEVTYVNATEFEEISKNWGAPDYEKAAVIKGDGFQRSLCWQQYNLRRQRKPSDVELGRLVKEQREEMLDSLNFQRCADVDYLIEQQQRFNDGELDAVVDLYQYWDLKHRARNRVCVAEVDSYIHRLV